MRHGRPQRPLACAFALLLFTLGACEKSKPPAPSPARTLNLWHTFNPNETAVLNTLLAAARKGEPSQGIRATVLPFAHAQSAFRRATSRCGPDAPDVLRVELPWVAGLAERSLLRPVPKDLLPPRGYLQAARQASDYKGKRWIVPASIDGLVLFYDKQAVAEPPKNLDQLLTIGKKLTVDNKGRHPGEAGFAPAAVKRWGFYIRGDSYWFLPFLWAFGGDLLDPARGKVFIGDAKAVEALRFYRDLATKHHIAPSHLRLSNDYEDQMRRFGRGELAMMINGPWATRGILKQEAYRGTPARLGVAPLPRGASKAPVAPLSGHGYVVTRCSKSPAAAWRLVARLAGVDAQARFAASAGLLPALAQAYKDPRVRRAPHIEEFRRALEQARGRPQHPVMSLIFDDFSAAVQAVLLGDAKPAESLSGVARAWRRLLGTKKIAASRPASGPASVPAKTAPRGRP